MDHIQILVHEHNNILRMLNVIRQASLRMIKKAAVDVDDLKKMVEFIRIYADKTHHGKEEVFLFQAMTERLGSVGENLIRHGMLVEHDLGRLYLSDLDAALNLYTAQPTDEVRLAILVAAGSYEQLLRRHIQKENDVIFPFAERSLPQQSLQWIEDKTHGFECEAQHAAAREQQLHVLDELEKKYSEEAADFIEA